jgi:hypothetical protein
MTPDQWLERLSKAMDDRADRLARLRAYMTGDAPLPEGADGCRDAFRAFQKKSRTHFGELVADAVVERMIPSGFTVGGAAEDDDRLRTIWKRNRMQVGINDVLRDMVSVSAGYMIVSEGAPREAVISCERPEQVITEQSAARPDRVRAALKVYRDDVEGFDVAYLHTVGVVDTFYRPIRDTHGKAAMRVAGGWTWAGAEPTGLEFVPVFPFLNRGGLGEFEPHTDILDRINWNILQRLVITAMQAYRQRALTSKDGDALPTVDADGNEIDYEKVFSAAPGAMWEMPPGFDIWESQQTDITAILAANKDDITHLAAVTRTPMPTMMPGGENQTAEGASFAKEGLVFKAQDRVARASASLDLVMGAALAIESGLSVPVADVESKWLPVERQSLAERADAATKAQDLPWRTRMTDIWQFSEDRVDQMETERASDALNASLSQPPAPPVTDGNAPA